jgi:glycoside hydrolase family 3 protein
MTVMAAYNKVRGLWCTENSYLLDSLLRGELGFDGMVVSDWNAVHNTERTALCSMDVEMGTNTKGNGKEMFKQYYLADSLLQKVKNGEIPEEAVNKKVRNILKLMFRLDLIKKAPYDTTGMAAKLATLEHCNIARKIAEESFVLLRNSNHMLPLDPAHYKKIAVIGANAEEAFARGGGSTKLKAKYEITPLKGLHNFLGNNAQIEYATGYKLNKKAYKVGHWFTNEFETPDPELIKHAVATAAKAELVIYVGGLSHDHGSDCEGYDKPNLKLPYGQDQLLEAILKVNPNTVIVLMTGGPVELGKWYEHSNTLLHCSFIGMEGGNALARILFGEVNPSGKLTTTWCKKLEDMPDHIFGEYPGKNDTVRFKEGIMVGYRYFDTYQIKPQFEFGFGLSYTSFEYSDLDMNPIWNEADDTFDVSFTVSNTGKRYGQEIAQLYVHQQECSVQRPVKELKGFEKVALQPGESQRVTIKLTKRALQYYDIKNKGWKADPGTFTIQIGASSRDIRLQKNFKLEKL